MIPRSACSSTIFRISYLLKMFCHSSFQNMNFLTYEEVEGRRRGSKLIWVMEEKCLYSIKDVRNEKRVYLCYQNQIDPTLGCSSRCSIDSSGIMSSNSIPHSNHSNHVSIYEDLKTRSNIIDSCVEAANVLKDLHVTIPNQQIFTREIAK